MVDRVRPLVLEQPSTGGTQLDFVPVEVDPKEDGVDARAFFAQNGTSADSTAYVSRASADLTLTDANAGTKRAQDLISQVLGAQAAHQSLPHLAHFLDDGPGDGWASGAVLRIVRNGPLVTNRTWYASASASSPAIFGISRTYKTGTPLVATQVMTVYGPTGVALRAATDTYQWSGVFLSQVTRTWA